MTINNSILYYQATVSLWYYTCTCTVKTSELGVGNPMVPDPLFDVLQAIGGRPLIKGLREWAKCST